MATSSLEICKGFDRENDSGCKISPRTLLTVKSLINLWTLHCHKINITDASRLLNPSLGSKFS